MDPISDRELPGAVPSSRRGFLQGVGLAAFASVLGEVPFAQNFPPGLVPVAWGAEQPLFIPGKAGLRILNDRPVNAETPVTLLDDDLTLNKHHFVRNNGHVPERANGGSLEGWSLTVDGEVDQPLKLTLKDLQTGFAEVAANYVIECGGNGRAGYNPPAKGNQWTLGAVGCARYRGVRLADVLKRAGLKPSAVYLGYYGEDPHLSRDPSKQAISRGFPLAKALDPNTLLAWEMNGQPLPPLHGWPLRLVCPGWPGSTSGKWLRRIWVRDQVHDGEKMTGFSYRVPRNPVAPGTEVPEEDMVIIEEMPVKSIITRPGTGVEIPVGRNLPLRGHAWSGHGEVKAVHVSHDFGGTWTRAALAQPPNPFAWQRWSVELKLPQTGYYEIWARATDVTGRMQPMVVPGWNPRGYLNNAMQRIAVRAI